MFRNCKDISELIFISILHKNFCHLRHNFFWFCFIYFVLSTTSSGYIALLIQDGDKVNKHLKDDTNLEGKRKVCSNMVFHRTGTEKISANVSKM